jgi:glutamate synthase (NADPH/NADH) small chain
MDAAVTAAQARAARVTVLYRRTAREMPAWPREYRGAIAAGVEFQWLAQPVAFEGAGKVEGGGQGTGAAGGKVTAVRCVRMSLGGPDASGRAAPRPVPGSEFTIEADLVVMALGQGPNQEIVEAFGLAADKAGRPVVDASGRASASARVLPAGHVLKAKIFVAGDLGSGGATVVRAVAEGKRAARAAAGELPPSTPRGEAGSNGR